MSRKNFIKIAGVLATVLSLCGATYACHLFSKKNAEPKNSDNQNETKYGNQNENGNPSKVEYISKYAIPDDMAVGKYAIPKEEEIIIEKYAVPPEIDNIPVLKYATPKIIIQPPAVKYAAPYLPDDNDVKIIDDSDSDKDNGVVMPMYAVPSPKFDTDNTNQNSAENQNPWK